MEWLVLVYGMLLLCLISLAAVIYPFKPFENRWKALAASVICLFLVGLFAPRAGPAQDIEPDKTTPETSGQYWVTSQRLNRRTCPTVSCGVVGQHFYRESATVLEANNGWARITQPYDASCVNGTSQYVDSGNADCTAANGIIDGQFSEWVSLDHLSKTRPDDPAESAVGAETLVSGSDDFARYRTAFTAAAGKLIADGRCTVADFQEMGGWVKSTNHPDTPVYFTYCGGSTLANRLYLKATNGEIFR